MRQPSLLYLDIETLPAPDALEPVIKELYAKQPERQMTYEQYWRGTSLNANFGQILCIGYAENNEPAQTLTGSEPEQLRAFWQLTKDVDQLIGHAILNFDLPFIIKRSIIHQVKINPKFSLTKETAPGVIDTKRLWDIGAGPAISLDTFAKIFGFETSKQGINGSQVYDFWVDGQQPEIYAYCARDVELTRQIYQRLMFDPKITPIKN